MAIGVPTAARIPSGAIVERMVDTPFDKAESLVLNLRDNDFSTNSAIVSAINSKFGPNVAQSIDGTSISVRAPQDLSQRVTFMSMLENIEVVPGEPPARVVINARTGTVVDALDPDVALPPASTAKVITALYAWERLGPSFRFGTRLLATGPVTGGQIRGDLVLAGSGDPTLSTDMLAAMAADPAPTPVLPDPTK